MYKLKNYLIIRWFYKMKKYTDKLILNMKLTIVITGEKN